MRIFIDNGTTPMPEFQLPVGYTMELARTNPFLTDEGSQSIPLTLPPSDHNLRLVGYLHRGTSRRRPVRRLNVMVQHDGVSMRGSLAFDSANRREGISCTFYTSEGQLYETIGEKKLGDLEWPEIHMGLLPGYTSKVLSRLNWFKQVMDESLETDYYVFPVLTDNDITTTGAYGKKYILNETISKDTVVDNLKFLGETARKWVNGEGSDKVTIDLPLGYGATPFLKISYILRFIFSQFGYTLKQNMFDTQTSLRRLCLLNNTADAICNEGTIFYRQLIPEQVGVMDFINMIRRKFGVEFVERGTTIEVVTWNTALSRNPDDDLSRKVVDDITFDVVDASALEITMNRGLSPYANVEGTGEDSLIQKYGPLVHLTTTTWWNLPAPGQTGLDDSTGRYYAISKKKDNTFLATWVSGPYWDKQNLTGLPTETVEMSDLAVPELQAAETVDNGTFFQGRSLTVPYIGGLRNLNTSVSMSDNSIPGEEESSQLELMMCFCMPGWMYHEQGIYKMGSSFNYSPLTLFGPIRLLDIRLAVTGEDNLYDLFYASRDRMLRHANQIVKFDALLLPEQIASMDLSYPKIVNGIKVLIERIDYVLGQRDICKVTARTLHEYEDE